MIPWVLKLTDLHFYDMRIYKDKLFFWEPKYGTTILDTIKVGEPALLPENYRKPDNFK